MLAVITWKNNDTSVSHIHPSLKWGPFTDAGGHQEGPLQLSGASALPGRGRAKSQPPGPCAEGP